MTDTDTDTTRTITGTLRMEGGVAKYIDTPIGTFIESSVFLEHKSMLSAQAEAITEFLVSEYEGDADRLIEQMNSLGTAIVFPMPTRKYMGKASVTLTVTIDYEFSDVEGTDQDEAEDAAVDTIEGEIDEYVIRNALSNRTADWSIDSVTIESIEPE